MTYDFLARFEKPCGEANWVDNTALTSHTNCSKVGGSEVIIEKSLGLQTATTVRSNALGNVRERQLSGHDYQQAEQRGKFETRYGGEEIRRQSGREGGWTGGSDINMER